MSENEYTSHATFADVTAFILTGGKSQRMGQDKALLKLSSGITLLEHAIAVAGAVVGEVRIVGPRERYAHFAWAGEIIEDIFPERGPLGGIHAGLSSSESEWNLFLAVDLPRATPALLTFLVQKAKQQGSQVTVPRVGDRLQPLCSVYRCDFLQRAAQALESNRNKIDAAFDPNNTYVLESNELVAAGFTPELFQNVNTPDDFASAVRER